MHEHDQAGDCSGITDLSKSSKLPRNKKAPVGMALLDQWHPKQHISLTGPSQQQL